MSSSKAVVITTEGLIRHIVVEQLPDLQAAVGGYIEFVACTSGDLIINEEGKLKGLAMNPVATSMAQAAFGIMWGDFIAGDAVLVGPPDADGELTDVLPVAVMVAMEHGARLTV